jgi:type I restriction enzyme M protein
LKRRFENIITYGTGLAACILVFRQRKKRERKKHVLVLDASREFKTGRAQNELLLEHVERIYGWYRDYKSVEGVARVVNLEEISENDFNLNIPRYVEPQKAQGALTIEESMKHLEESARAAFAAEDRNSIGEEEKNLVNHDLATSLPISKEW